jgi:hypothetical protein
MSSNVARRHMNKGQLDMVWAMLTPNREREHALTGDVQPAEDLVGNLLREHAWSWSAIGTDLELCRVM